MTYAAQKGRANQPALKASPAIAPSEVSAATQTRIEANKQFVQEAMPDLIPFMRDLHAAGLIDGWRSIANCKLIGNDAE